MTDAEDRPTTYVAFLRGVNVGAHNRMKMAALRESCGALGWADVRTYIQSGNVVFECPETDARTLGDELEAAIADSFGYDVAAMVRTRPELEEVAARQPFDEPADEDATRYVAFLRDEPADERVRALLSAGTEAESFVVTGREVYSRVRRDRLEAGRFTDVGDLLDAPATRRRWNVVEAVLELASA